MFLVRKSHYRLLSILGILAIYFGILVSMTLHSSTLTARAVEVASNERETKIAAQQKLQELQEKPTIQEANFIEPDKSAPVNVLIDNPKPPPPPPPPPVVVPAPAPAVEEPAPAQAPQQQNTTSSESKKDKSTKSAKSKKNIKSSQADDQSSQVDIAPNSGDPKASARSQMVAYNWDDSEFTCLVNLWNRESGWDFTAENKSSGAYGIPQSLPGSKMASAGADWKTNPATQIAWGLKYIDGRYGSPCGAWAHSENKGWY